MIVLDASVWVSYMVPQDINHLTSRRWINQYLAGGGQIVAPLLLTVEVGGAVARRSGRSVEARQAVGIIVRLPTMRWIVLDDRLTLAATRLAIDLRLRGADALYVAVAVQFNIPLITWDHEQIDRAGVRFEVRTPATS
jgi:predicted nucleic acid-binding protein